MAQRIPLPTGFTAIVGVAPIPVGAIDGAWYISVYGAAAGQSARAHVLKWTPVTNVCELVTLEQYTDARGALGVGDNKIQFFSWEEASPNELWVQPLVAPQPALMTAHRVDTRLVPIEARLASLEARIAALEA